MRLRGWVYVITNEAMPGLVKIGYSMKDPWLRASELANTGAPHPYKVAYDALAFDPRDIEQAAHQRLNALQSGKEWFRCSIEDAISAILAVSELGGETAILVETRHQAGHQDISTLGADAIAKREKFYKTFGPGFRPATEAEGRNHATRIVQEGVAEMRTAGGTIWQPPQNSETHLTKRSQADQIRYRCTYCGTESFVPTSRIAKCDYCGKTGYL